MVELLSQSLHKWLINVRVCFSSLCDLLCQKHRNASPKHNADIEAWKTKFCDLNTNEIHTSALFFHIFLIRSLDNNYTETENILFVKKITINNYPGKFDSNNKNKLPNNKLIEIVTLIDCK